MTILPEPEDKSLKILRKIVISMGVMLVVGTILLFVMVIIKSNNAKKK